MYHNLTPRTTRDVASLTMELLAALARGASGDSIPLAKNTEVPSSGYFVGGLSDSLVVRRAELRASTVEWWVARTAAGTAPEGRYLGVWVDGDDVYFDLSEVHQDKAVALDLATLRGEKAIFDITTGEDILTQTAA